MGDFLRFETMITPILIQAIFWIGSVISLIAGVVIALNSDSAGGFGIALAVFVLGPIVMRLYSEILIVVFRINDHLRQIQHNTQRP